MSQRIIGSKSLFIIGIAGTGLTILIALLRRILKNESEQQVERRYSL